MHFKTFLWNFLSNTKTIGCREKNIWWRNEQRKSSDNKPLSEEIWKELYDNSTKQLSGKKLYVQDGFVGANEDTRMKVRFIVEVAWQA
ncbi:MAG: phosphoenolpyruvate carboxykinase (ATP), partial [Promethearchaeota archaeon]